MAAGLARRFGRQKLLERFADEPLVRRAARAFVDAACEPVQVVISDESLRSVLTDLRLDVVFNPAPEQGISHSIAIAMAAVSKDASGIVIGVADQPRLSAAVVRTLLDAFVPGAIVVPRYGENPGNPRIYDRRFFGELAALGGDRGGQVIAERHPRAVIVVPLAADLGVDVDTPDDWARLG